MDGTLSGPLDEEIISVFSFSYTSLVSITIESSFGNLGKLNRGAQRLFFEYTDEKCSVNKFAHCLGLHELSPAKYTLLGNSWSCFLFLMKAKNLFGFD